MLKKNTEEKTLNVNAKEFRSKEKKLNVNAEDFRSKELNVNAKDFRSKICTVGGPVQKNLFVKTGFKGKIFKKGTLEHFCFPAPKVKEKFVKPFHQYFDEGEFKYFVFQDNEFTRMVLDVTRAPEHMLTIKGIFADGEWSVHLDEVKKQDSLDESGGMKTRKEEKDDGDEDDLVDFQQVINASVPFNLFPHPPGLERSLCVYKPKDFFPGLDNGKDSQSFFFYPLEETMNEMSQMSLYNKRNGLSGMSKIEGTEETSNSSGTRGQAFYCEKDPFLTYVVVTKPLDTKQASFELKLERGNRDLVFDKKK